MSQQFAAASADPYEPYLVPLGRKGTNLQAVKTELSPEECYRLWNVWMRQWGSWTVRPGLSFLGSTGLAEDVHTIQRLNYDSTYTRFWGSGTQLWRGQTPALGVAVVDTGYSGDPLTLLRARPRRSGQSWMLVADRNKIRQFSPTGTAEPLGVPTAPVGQSAGTVERLTRNIARFSATDGSQAASWAMAAGVDRSDTPRAGGTPAAADVTGADGAPGAVAFTTTVGDAQEGYSSLVSLQRTLDLTQLDGGTAAGAEDLIHLWLKVDQPALLEEIRVYFVCSNNFAPDAIPGTAPGKNSDAFVKAFRPHDFTGFIEGLLDSIRAGQTTRERGVLEDALEGIDTTPPEEPPLNFAPQLFSGFMAGAAATGSTTGGQASPGTQTSQQLQPGRETWSEFGVVGKPLRRGEFLRIGSTPSASWATITGIVIVIQTAVASSVVVSCDDWFLTGGYNLDSSEPDSQPYDWRYTHVNTATGDEGNPSPVMNDQDRVDCLRQRVRLVPTAFGSAAYRQRFYRRGGTLNDDWYYLGENTSDGGAFIDNVSDDALVAASTLELDNHQPVSTLDANGNTVTAQPLPVLAGPLGGLLFGLGDPYRPGYLYWSKTERFGSWPPANRYEVCPPSETLQNMVLYAGEGYLFSRERMYRVLPNLTGGASVAVQDTPNGAGLAARWAITVGRDGIYYVARDGVRRTRGGESEVLSDAIRPLFLGQAIEVYGGEFEQPIDWAYPARIRLGVFQQLLLLQYRATDGSSRVWACDLSHGFQWMRWIFPVSLASFAMEDQDAPGTPAVFGVGGAGNGTAWQLVPGQVDEVTADAYTQIAWEIITGHLDGGRPRDDKELAEVAVEASVPVGTSLYLETAVNHAQTVNTTLLQAGTGTLQRYLFNPFGTTPQQVRNVQLRLLGYYVSGAATLFDVRWAAIAARVIAEQVRARATTWETLGDGAEVYLTGCSLLLDTEGVDLRLRVRTRLGTTETVAIDTTVTANGRRRVQLSWPAVHADMVRIEPYNDVGLVTPWRLYAVDWLQSPEPPRVSGWDSNWEAKGDTYHTGLDLEVDTLGAAKRVEVWVDQVRLADPATGLPYWTVTASGRQLVHLTLPWGRGHLYRFVAIDTNPGLLYSHQWILAPEPGEQTNWNEPFTVEGTLGDKYIKGVLVDCDTFGQPKTLEIQVDGVAVATWVLTQNGRGVQHFSLPTQVLGRVLRLWPTDANPGRLYTRQWIFDEEPLKLARWETQLQDFGQGGWLTLLDGFVTYRAPDAAVTVQVEVYDNAGGLLTTLSQVLAVSAGKRKAYLQPASARGVLFKVLVTSAQAFWLYRGESRLRLAPWGSTDVLEVQPFGDDDLDKTRSLSRATAIAGAV